MSSLWKEGFFLSHLRKRNSDLFDIYLGILENISGCFVWIPYVSISRVDQSYFHGLIVEETLATHRSLFWTICLGLVYTSTQMATQTNHIPCHKSAGMHLRRIDIEECCFHYRWLEGWYEYLYKAQGSAHMTSKAHVVCVKSAWKWCRLQQLWWIHNCARK